MQHGGTQDERLSAAGRPYRRPEPGPPGAGDARHRSEASRAGRRFAKRGRARPAAAHHRAGSSRTRSRSACTTAMADVDLSSQRAQVAQARAGLSAAQSSYANVDVHAPFAGTVYSLPVAQYDFVQAGAGAHQRRRPHQTADPCLLRRAGDRQTRRRPAGLASTWAAQAQPGLARPRQAGAHHRHHLRHAQRRRVPHHRR